MTEPQPTREDVLYKRLQEQSTPKATVDSILHTIRNRNHEDRSKTQLILAMSMLTTDLIMNDSSEDNYYGVVRVLKALIQYQECNDIDILDIDLI